MTSPLLTGLLKLLSSRHETLSNIDQEFLRRHDDYITERDKRQKRFDEIDEDFAKLAKHHAMPCSEQHSLEAQWRINYSDEWQQVDKDLDTFAQSLKNTEQKPLEQDAEGSWGHCYGEWYRKLEPTVDALQEERLPDKPKALAFMDRLKNVDSVLDALRHLSASNIVETGRNNRDEYGAWLTALSQLAFKPALREVLATHPSLEFSMAKDYVDKYRGRLFELQHEDTGYWGPAYRFGGKDVAVQDLSFTFHIVHYYTQIEDKDWPRLPNLDRIAATTLAIKDRTYPNGWLTKGGNFNDHNNFDVMTLFALSWDDASPALQKEIAPEIQMLINWCLTNTYKGDHFGDKATISSYYYGVRFLDEAGLWKDGDAFWWKGAIPLPNGLTANGIRARLREGFLPKKDGSEYSETVAKILGA